MRAAGILVLILAAAGGAYLLLSGGGDQPDSVAPGVTLEGRDVAGWEREDVMQLVDHLARDLEIPPSDPTYDSASQSLMPGHFGVRVDRRETLRRVMAARPGSRVHAVQSLISPRDLLDHEVTAVYAGRPDLPLVSLVVNVAWGEKHLPALLGVLGDHGARATFSVMGFWLEENAEWGREIRRQGHELAAHGYTDRHPEEMTGQELTEELEALAELMDDLGLGRPSCYTPHYGERADHILRGAREAGLATVYWSVDTLDWQGPSPEEIVGRVKSRLHPGAILLLHPTEEVSRALEDILPLIEREGLKVVPVGRLLRPIP